MLIEPLHVCEFIHEIGEEKFSVTMNANEVIVQGVDDIVDDIHWKIMSFVGAHLYKDGG